MRVSRHPHRSSDIQVQPLFLAEIARSQGVSQAARYHQGRIFSGLRQQHHELVAAIAECVVDQAQLGFDLVSDLGQQLASYEVAMRIVDLLEVVEVNEYDSELVVVSRLAINFRFQRLVQMTRVVQPGHVIGDRQFLNSFKGSRILDRNRRIVA